LVRFDINGAKPTLVVLMSNGSSQPEADMLVRHIRRIVGLRCARKLNWAI
jgi:hypothetical protein